MAYADRPLLIGAGQTISQPYIVGLMSELLQLRGDETVLEVGTGSGYQAAVLSLLASEVHTIERIPHLGEQALLRLKALGYTNVTVHFGDGSHGLQNYAPFGGILAAAAAPRVPPPLLMQLADGARLIIPVGDEHTQVLQVWQRQGDDFHCSNALPVIFVPLKGDFGWAVDG